MIGMNWYALSKKAVTDTTMDYFREFADQGQYVPDRQGTADFLQTRFNTNIVSDIGCGDNGCAYLLSNGNVLKITTNENEGRQSMWLSANPNPFIAEIYDVHKEGDLWYIVMEKIDKAPADLIRAVEGAESHLHRLGIYNARISALAAIRRWPGITGPYGRQIVEYINHLSRCPKAPYDYLNSSNVGIKNGVIKFFDIT